MMTHARVLQRKSADGVRSGKDRVGAQSKLAVNRPGDRFEKEADRMADFVVSGGRAARPHSFSNVSLGTIQREDKTPPEPPKTDNYDDALKKIADALAETDTAKQLKAKATEMGKDFLNSVEGKVIAGSALGGALATIIATNSKLPMQLPELPLDFIAPGLKAKLVWEGPVRNPTNVSLSLTSKSGVSVEAGYTSTPASGGKPAEQKAGLTLTIPLGSSPEKKKGGPTDSQKYRAETARIAAEQEKFRAGMKTPGGKADDEAFVDSYFKYQLKDPTNPLGIEPLKKKEDLLLMRKETNESSPATAPALCDGVLAGEGQPLDHATRDLMEARFGHDFSRVRVHSDARAAESAEAVNAHAYTIGEQIVFASAQFNPASSKGKRLLAHELTHVIQQRGEASAVGQLGPDATSKTPPNEKQATPQAKPQLNDAPNEPIPLDNAATKGPAIEVTNGWANPGGKTDRTTVGIGELNSFVVQDVAGGSWKSADGKGKTINSVSFQWTASAAGTNNITYTAADKSISTVTMTTEVPSSLAGKKDNDRTYAAGTQGAGMDLTITVQPTTVSFQALEIMESVCGPSVRSGFFSTHTPPSHDAAAGAGTWNQVGTNNDISDTADSSGWSAPWSQGSYTWAIPVSWRLAGKQASTAFSKTSDQVVNITGADGTTVVSKLGAKTNPRKP